MPSHPRSAAFVVLVCIGLLQTGLAAGASADESPVGTRPPEWEVGNWINSKPLALKDLEGKVVLVRWWFGPGCPFCTATAPALNAFHDRYRERGLVVVGFYHHKSKAPLDLDKVKALTDRMGFRFPVAVDHGWKTLRAWWLDGHERGWTSVSFLLDRKGVIRHVHPGGKYVEGDAAHAELKAKIEELLAEK